MKAIKFIAKLLLWIVGIVVVLVLALPLWIGPVVKTAANAIVPKKTGTEFNLGAFALNPYAGKLSVGDMQLWNPQDFSQKMAATLGSLDVAVEVSSLAGDVIVVKDIVLKDIFVSYVSNGKGENNFAIIKKNAAGTEEEKLKGGQRIASSPSLPSQPSQPSQPSKKVIIDHLLIANVMVQLGPISLPMPNIELTGIGRKDGGATMPEAWNQIYAQIVQNLNSLGVNINELMGGLGNASMEQVLKAVGPVGDLKTRKGRERAVKNLVDVFAGGADIVGGAVGQTTDAVGSGAKKATGAVGDATTKSADAVGEQADKAVNALKGLFK